MEVIKNQRVYSLDLCPESPLQDVYEVLNQMRNYILDRIESEKKNQEEMKAEAEVEKVEVK